MDPYQPQKSSSWFVTLNNVSPNSVLIRNPLILAYAASWDIAPTTGRLHIHFWFRLDREVGRDFFTRYVFGVHPCDATPTRDDKQAILYIRGCTFSKTLYWYNKEQH